jgi:hypothetical protein
MAFGLVVAFVVAATPTASATHVQCGDVIRHDTKLDSDLDCSQVVDRPDDCWGLGLFSREHPITLDLGGHRITGPGRDACYPYLPVGIAVEAPGATVRNGTIERFDMGIMTGEESAEEFSNLTLREHQEAIYGSARRIVNNRFEDNWYGLNLYLVEGPGTVNISRNVMTGTLGAGISISSPEDVVLDRNRVSNSGGYGIHLRSWTYWVPSHYVTDNGNYVLSRNSADHNGRDGIYVEVPSTTITQNKASFNGNLGIEAVAGVTDGGKNKARGNGNPAQCVGVSCR